MELETNLNEISSWTDNFTRKKLAFIGTGVLVATVVCISVIVALSVKSSPSGTIVLSESPVTKRMELIKDEIRWVSYNSDNYSLVDAVAGGSGANGKTIYVCRAQILASNRKDRELVPGTFDPTDGLCKVAYSYKAINNKEFDFLVTKDSSRLVWESESNGGLKNGAISAGLAANKKDLYIARFQYFDYKVLGELYVASKQASGPDRGTQVYRESYDHLCVADYAL